MFAPQLLLLLVFLARTHRDFWADFFSFLSLQFGHGQLLVYSIATLSFVFIALRGPKLLDRSAFTTWFVIAAMSSTALLFEQDDPKLNETIAFIFSLLIFGLVAYLAYAAIVYVTYNPEGSVEQVEEESAASIKILDDAVGRIMEQEAAREHGAVEELLGADVHTETVGVGTEDANA